MIRKKMKGRTPVQRRGGALESIGVPPFNPYGYVAEGRADCFALLVADCRKSLHAFHRSFRERLLHAGLGDRGKRRFDVPTAFQRRDNSDTADRSRQLSDDVELALESPAEDAEAKMDVNRNTPRERKPVILPLGEQQDDPSARYRCPSYGTRLAAGG